jgi:hypothetical protein
VSDPQDETTRLQAIRDKPTQHWAVMVYRNGADILTIESNHLSGKPEFSDEDAQCIRDCARHLLAFIGGEDPASALEAARQEIAEWKALYEKKQALYDHAHAQWESAEAQVDALTRAQADKTLLRDWRWQDEALQRIYGMAQDALGIEPPHVIVPDDVADLVERAFNAERATVDALTAALRALEAKWRKEVAGGWRNGVVIAIERCADDLAVLLDERGSR